MSQKTKIEKPNKFGLLRKLLKALGLKPQAIDEIVDRINELLSGAEEEKPKSPEYPYRMRDDFLTPAEHSFYLVLQQAVADWALICPKVSLGDLFFAKAGDYGKNRSYTNKIDRKHIDFLLCDPNTVKPLLGIELDDKSHERADRQARDEFVQNVFLAAKLPLIRVPVRRNYPVSQLRAGLQRTLGLTEEQIEDNDQLEKTKTPKCPKCGDEMVLRTTTRGKNAGQQFWGCPNYPKCRGTLAYKPD